MTDEFNLSLKINLVHYRLKFQGEFMRKIVSFILMNMISTSLVFAHETRLSQDKEIVTMVNLLDQVYATEKNQNFCEVAAQNKMIARLNFKIQQAKKSSRTLEQEIVKYTAIYENLYQKQSRQTKKILKSSKKLNRLYHRVIQNNPEVTFTDFKQGLIHPISTESKEGIKNLIESELKRAGSVVNFLENVQEKVENCDAITSGSDNQTWYLVLLIVFLGLPVLSILGALFAVLFAAWWWALGLFVFAVVMLGILFIIAQLGKNKAELKSSHFSDLAEGDTTL
jgi:ABC-type multidrug transport system fused ATPase/permease subunit